ncbi:MAG: carbohydrate binding domain-containing protein [Spirochaetales bacterium]|nr:carbohydrate binding domain-containing protein [Spirochaetales bacterium]
MRKQTQFLFFTAGYCLLLLITACTPPAGNVVNSVNLALGKTVVVSSTGNGMAGTNAVDGDLGSYWESATNGAESIYVDLGEAKAIAQIVLDWFGYGFPSAYTIQSSDDAAGWTDIFTETTGNGKIDDITVSTTSRYIKINIQTAGTSSVFKLYEFAIYDVAGNNAASPAPAGNMVFNGDFSNGLWQWETYVDALATASISVDNGAAYADITNGSNLDWHVQLIGFPVPVYNSRQYTLTFNAWANADRNINIEIQKYGGDWLVYDNSPLFVSTTPTAFYLKMIMDNPDDPTARLNFNIGNSNTGIHIDDVILTEQIITIPSMGTEMIVNGNFASGTDSWTTYVQNGAGVNISESGGVLNIDVTSPGTIPGDLHVGQGIPGLCLIEGKTYKLTLDSYAAGERPMTLWISEGGHDVNKDTSVWGAMFNQKIELKTSFNSYAYYFTIPVNYTNYSAGTTFFCGEYTQDIYIDNVSVVEVSGIPHQAPWSTTSSTPGGADSGSAVSLGSLDNWYESSIGTLGDSMWYSLTVSTSEIYEVFWNDYDLHNFLTTYLGNVVVSIYHSDGTTPYITNMDFGYYTPIIVSPSETIILIEVKAANSTGSFAIGVHQQ